MKPFRDWLVRPRSMIANRRQDAGISQFSRLFYERDAKPMNNGAMRKRVRKDAFARREQIIAVAEKVFEEGGYDVPLEEIIVRSGIGRGTLYRNFEDRRSLALAVLDRAIDRLACYAADVADDDQGIFKLVSAMADIVLFWHDMARHTRLTPAPGDAARQAVIRKVEHIVAAPLARAISAGLIRADLAPADITALALMIAAPAEYLPLEDKAGSIETMMRLLIEGLRPR